MYNTYKEGNPIRSKFMTTHYEPWHFARKDNWYAKKLDQDKEERRIENYSKASESFKTELDLYDKVKDSDIMKYTDLKLSYCMITSGVQKLGRVSSDYTANASL